jgi:hypothetical protein
MAKVKVKANEEYEAKKTFGNIQKVGEILGVCMSN